MSSEINSFDLFPDGTFLIDKPTGWTSFDAVNKIRRISRIKKVGHAGTLDPAATGLLIICTGKRTKLLEGFQAQKKFYSGTITFGWTTPSYDSETEKTAGSDPSRLTLEQIRDAVQTRFTGTILQIPPMFSALKRDGKKLYELARKGKEIKLEPREITVDSFQISGFENGTATFRVTCSKGTYIRSLAHDLGQVLGTGAYLSSLRREAIGQFSVADAWDIIRFEEEFKSWQSAVTDEKEPDSHV